MARPDHHTFWLSTIDADGRPHMTAVGAFWVDGRYCFCGSPRSRKIRNIERDPRCAFGVAIHGYDVALEGRAARVTDDARLQRLAAVFAEGSWAPTVADGGFTHEYSAPSAGPPPWTSTSSRPTMPTRSPPRSPAAPPAGPSDHHRYRDAGVRSTAVRCALMQRHEVAFTVAAPPHRVWRLLHPKVPPGATVPRTIEHPGGTITILREGDEDGAGLVRTCTFPVPRWLLSGGVARSWEVVTEARRDEYARYEAVGKPLWSTAGGSHTLEPIDGGERTRLTFVETYHAHNPVLRALFEARVHRFISRDNTRTYETVLGYLGDVSRER